MREFEIRIRSFQDVQDFVSVASVQPFRIIVSSSREIVNAKSFIGMASLDYSQPIMVRCDCTTEQLEDFRQQAERFLA
ncbi:MAG: hypothetical protein LUH51_05995 [Firmicutes bacterium]|nr:hypothetical protein [Bacillota bacterium]